MCTTRVKRVLEDVKAYLRLFIFIFAAVMTGRMCYYGRHFQRHDTCVVKSYFLI